MLAQTTLDYRPKRHPVGVTLFGAEEGGAGSGQAQAYRDEECFDRILATTAAIEDYFEQVLGVLDPKIL